MGRGINIYNLDCLVGMKDLGDESVDLITTDPPYGISFMGKDWDKALPDIRIWQECLRVLKAGSFAFVMSIPRSDCLSRMIISLEDAGFNVGFSPIYWAYASGFPKAQNIGKAVDKRLGAEREVVGKTNRHMGRAFGEGEGDAQFGTYKGGIPDLTLPESPQAKTLDGSYGGFQPKPAVEVIIVAMKPLSEKTFVDQALENRKGITWLDDCRIPIDKGDEPHGGYGDEVIGLSGFDNKKGAKWRLSPTADMGRFPANLLVSDDVLNDGTTHKSGLMKQHIEGGQYNVYGKMYPRDVETIGDSGSFSRYFDLDKWVQKTFPFLIVPKASKSEKNRGISGGTGSNTYNRKCLNCGKWERKQGLSDKYTCHCEKPAWEKPLGNYHPTVKPVKLFSYLVTLGSRAGDIVLDPFGGTMTTAVACAMLGREFIGYEIDAGSYEISQGRVKAGWQIKLEALGGKE